MNHQFETARFHVRTGPQPLFDRVRYILNEPTELQVNPNHVQQRAEKRDAPIEKLSKFDPDEWTLKTAEVRTDTGKFVNSAWSCVVNGRNWWVVIGYNDTAITVMETDKVGLGDKIVTEGELYEMVAEVNRELMRQDVTDYDS